MSEPPTTQPKPGGGADFDDYRDSYREAIEQSISFRGVDLDFFTRAKIRRLLDLAGRQLGPPGGLEVLDVGAGPGETDRLLHGHFGGLAGVDVAGRLLERAAEANPWVDYRSYGAGEPIPFDDGSFDLTFTISVLHHVPVADRTRFIAELGRVTREGGLVTIFEHNPWNPLTRRSVSNCEFDEGVVLLSRRRTTRLLAAGGLEPVESRYIVFFTREGELWQRAERRLGWLPAGAQYYVAARKPIAHERK